MSSSTSLRSPFPLWTYVAILAVALLAAYGRDVGRGFVKEDANWIMQSRIQAPADLVRVFRRTGGFFRPIVALSFGANHRMFGPEPRGYGWTNLLLAFACAAAIYQFAGVLGLPRAAALLAAALWILNFHGINMALLWLSGRTALLLVLFAVLAATAAVRDRIAATSVFAFLAMASKEEGIVLPVILLSVLWLRPGGRPSQKRIAAFAIALGLVWVVYTVLRMQSDAYTPGNAPAFYTFAAPPWSFWKNVTEYADRALTLSVAITLLALAVGRRWPTFDESATKRAVLGCTWIVAGFALTIFLPTRSSLYALFPSVGITIIAATVLTAAWRGIPEQRRRVLASAALVIPIAFVPAYWLRNQRWTELADVSRQTIAIFEELSRDAPERWQVIIVDDPSSRANIAASIGWGLTDAVELVTGKRPRVWIAPPPPDMEQREWVVAPATADAVLILRDQKVTRIPLASWTPTTAGPLQ